MQAKEACRYISSKQKHREDVCPLQNRAGKLVTNKADETEDLNTFFTSCLYQHR